MPHEKLERALELLIIVYEACEDESVLWYLSDAIALLDQILEGDNDADVR